MQILMAESELGLHKKIVKWKAVKMNTWNTEVMFSFSITDRLE